MVERRDSYARLVVADDEALVSSFDFLCDEVGGIGLRKRDVGVLISGAGPVETIVELLDL